MAVRDLVSLKHHNRVEASAPGTAMPLPLRQAIARQVPAWRVEALADCTCRTDHGSDYPGCRSEMTIFDSTGRTVVRGRDFGRGDVFYWQT